MCIAWSRYWFDIKFFLLYSCIPQNMSEDEIIEFFEKKMTAIQDHRRIEEISWDIVKSLKDLNLESRKLLVHFLENITENDSNFYAKSRLMLAELYYTDEFKSVEQRVIDALVVSAKASDLHKEIKNFRITTANKYANGIKADCQDDTCVEDILIHKIKELKDEIAQLKGK